MLRKMGASGCPAPELQSRHPLLGLSVSLLYEMIRTTLTSAVYCLYGLMGKAAVYRLPGRIKNMCGAPNNHVWVLIAPTSCLE